MGHIKTLDGWRAISIVVVVLSHLKDAVAVKGTQVYRFFEWGLNGVDLFFAISGYLVSYHLLHEREKTGTINLKTFYGKRLFRLMPILWFYLFVIWLMSVIGWVKVHPYEILSSLTFWRNYLVDHSAIYYTGQVWSLSLEEHFYFFLPLFLFFIKKNNRALWGLVAISLAVTVWRKFTSMPFVYDQYPWLGFNIWGTLGRFDALTWGVVLAIIHRHYKSLFSYLKYCHPLIVIGLLTIVFIYPIPLRPTWEAMLFPILVGSTIYWERSYVSRFLEFKPLKYLGRLSYSIYIWHMIFVYPMPNGPDFLQAVCGKWVSLIPILLLSIGSYHFIENPIRAWGYRLIKKN